MKKSTTLLILLLTSIIAFSQNSSFEYIFSDSVNLHQSILFEDIIELSNGDYVLQGDLYVLDDAMYQRMLCCYFSKDGELKAEKDFPDEEGYKYSPKSILKEFKDGNLYLVRALNVDNEKQLRDVHNSKIVINRIDSDLNTTILKEFYIPIDGTGAIDITSVEEIGNDNFVICFEKFCHNFGAHPCGQGNDTTFFWKIDSNLDIVKEGFIKHSKCNLDRNSGVCMIYDENNDKYLYYTFFLPNTSYNSGLTIYNMDSDFNLIGQTTMPQTIGGGSIIPFIINDTRNVSYKRTSRNTTVIGTSITTMNAQNLENFTSALCIEVDDDLNLIDSIHKGAVLDTNSAYLTRTPWGRCIDWVNDNEIFFAYTPHAYSMPMTGNPRKTQKCIITKLNREFNTIKEFSYGNDSIFLWINTIKATRDGGCIIAGHFRDISSGLPYNIEDMQGIVKKIPAAAFISVEEISENSFNTVIAYPNPGNNVLNIKTSLQNASVEVYNILGKVVYKQDITDISTAIPTGSWNSGIYMWKVYSNGKEAENGKWIKK